MATLAATHPTLLDVTKRLDPDGKIDAIVEILNQTNEVLWDAVFLEGNLPTGHRGTIRSGLPQPTWRKLYGGVQPTKSTTVQVTDSCGMLEDYAEVDKALADLNGNTAAFRLSEDRAHIEGLNQEFAQTLFLGNEVSAPEEFTGFGPRFANSAAVNGENVLKSENTTGGNDYWDIWLVVWGPNTAHCIYPKGSKAGITMEDKGQVTVENVSTINSNSSGRMEAYRTHYQWKVGLHVRDWRYIVRGCNISAAQLNKSGSAAGTTDLIDLMTRMVEMVPNLNMGRPVFYMNRTIRTFLRRQIVSKVAPATLTMDTVAGRKVMMFDEVPVRRVDALAAKSTTLIP